MPTTIRPEFKAELFSKLSARLRHDRITDTPEYDAGTEPISDDSWSRLFAAAYIPCRPNREFRAGLLEALLVRQSEIAPNLEKGRKSACFAAEAETVLPSPRSIFSSRLLRNLKRRQRGYVQRRRFLRQSVFLSLTSGLAAAALVIFVTGPAVFAPP
ncbi:MAG: hypothetical protein LBE84_09290, partial [Planctomycetota bacterium]|nr:hypothetical protein [Planctomycetota bacterium]